MSAIITNRNAVKKLAGLFLFTILMSFSNGFGGEGFQVYLNNKVVFEQFGSKMDVIQTLKLDQADENDQLSIIYHHCGRIAKNRTITIRDEQDKILKQWKFSDVKDGAARMTCKVKDILGLQTGKSSSLKLYYSSSELPKGRQIVAIGIPSKNIAKR